MTASPQTSEVAARLDDSRTAATEASPPVMAASGRVKRPSTSPVKVMTKTAPAAEPEESLVPGDQPLAKSPSIFAGLHRPRSEEAAA